MKTCSLCNKVVEKFSDPPYATCDECREKCRREGHPKDTTPSGWREVLVGGDPRDSTTWITELRISCKCCLIEKSEKEWREYDKK